MTEREQFEAWLQQPDANGSGVTNAKYLRLHDVREEDVFHGWQARAVSQPATSQPAPWLGTPHEFQCWKCGASNFAHSAASQPAQSSWTDARCALNVCDGEYPDDPVIHDPKCPRASQPARESHWPATDIEGKQFASQPAQRDLTVPEEKALDAALFASAKRVEPAQEPAVYPGSPDPDLSKLVPKDGKWYLVQVTAAWQSDHFLISHISGGPIEDLKKAPPADEAVTLLEGARRYVADDRLHMSELDRKRRGEYTQEYRDRISMAMQYNEDRQELIDAIDAYLAKHADS
jgi:hypothetical protein